MNRSTHPPIVVTIVVEERAPHGVRATAMAGRVPLPV